MKYKKIIISLLSIGLLFTACDHKDNSEFSIESKEESKRDENGEKIISEDDHVKVIETEDGSYIEQMKNPKKGELPVMVPDNYVLFNEIYKIPSTLGELLNTGWKIESDTKDFEGIDGSWPVSELPNEIEPGSSFNLVLSKYTPVYDKTSGKAKSSDEINKINIVVINNTDETITDKNKLSVLITSIDKEYGNKDFYMGNIKFGISMEKVEDIYTNLSKENLKYTGDDDRTVWAVATASDNTLMMYFDETGKLNKVIIFNENMLNSNNKELNKKSSK